MPSISNAIQGAYVAIAMLLTLWLGISLFMASQCNSHKQVFKVCAIFTVCAILPTSIIIAEGFNSHTLMNFIAGTALTYLFTHAVFLLKGRPPL
ncbi:MAG: hypothetical protein ACRCWR_10870 [Saezia sp.]